jgi:hypothetical protein
VLTGFPIYLNVIILAVFNGVTIFVKSTEPTKTDGDETPVVCAV